MLPREKALGEDATGKKEVAPVVLCLPDSGTKIVGFGRRGNVTVVVNVHSSSRRSLQHRLQKTTSVGRARKPGSAPIPAQTQPPPGHRATTGQLDPHMRQALQSLDSVDLLATLRSKTSQFQTPPSFLRGSIPGGPPFRIGANSRCGHRSRFSASMVDPPPPDALAPGPRNTDFVQT